MAELVVPQVRTELPGPRTRALLERKDAVLNGPLRDWTGVPLAVAAQGRLHHRGPGRQHVRRPRQRLGCLAVRRAAAVRPRRHDPGLGPLRDGDHRTTCRASRSSRWPSGWSSWRLADHPGGADRHRHGGGRGRGQAGPRGDRPPDDPQLPRAVPRRVDVPGRRELDRHLGADDGERAVRAGVRLRAVPEPLPRAVPPWARPVRRHDVRRLHRGLAAASAGRAGADRRRPHRAGRG